MRRVVFASILVVAGCSTAAEVADQDGACDVLEGRTFSSVAEYECGLTPTGVALCHWTVEFVAHDDASSHFEWNYSDVQESGYCECHGAAVTTLSGSFGQGYSGSYDAETGRLTWDGMEYGD